MATLFKFGTQTLLLKLLLDRPEQLSLSFVVRCVAIDGLIDDECHVQSHAARQLVRISILLTSMVV